MEPVAKKVIVWAAKVKEVRSVVKLGGRVCDEISVVSGVGRRSAGYTMSGKGKSSL